MRDPKRCDDDIYRNGEVVGIYPISVAEAEKMADRLTNETGIDHDFNSAAGRIVMRRRADQAQEQE